MTRRTISFGRAKRGMNRESSDALKVNGSTVDAASRQPLDVRRLRASTDSAATAKGNLNIKRTTSWQRGHKQSARATSRSAEVAARLLVRATPLLLERMPAESRAPLCQARASRPPAHPELQSSRALPLAVQSSRALPLASPPCHPLPAP